MDPQKDLLKIEEDAVANTVGQWKSDVDEFKVAVILILASAGDEDEAITLSKVKALVQKLNPPAGMDDAALKAVKLAHAFGISMVEFALRRKDLPKIPVSVSSRKAVQGLDHAATEAIATAASNLNKTTKATQTSVLTAVAPILQSPAKSEAAVAWAVNSASNSAVAKQGKELGQEYVWISERDSCIHCISLNGVRSVKGQFPKNKTYAGKPMPVYMDTLPHPPRHPRCRCTIELGITQDYADALKREAIRSVLKGVHLPSESEKVRLDAAKRLLDQSPEAPQSVQKYAARAIKRGKFDG